MMAIYQVLRGHVRSLYAPTCRCRRVLVHDHYYVSLSLYGRRGTAHTFIGPWGSDGVPYTLSHNLLDLLTTMISLLLQGTVICSVSWLLWKYFRQLVVKSPLDNIPGPSSHSFLYGEHFRACRVEIKPTTSSSQGISSNCWTGTGGDFSGISLTRTLVLPGCMVRSWYVTAHYHKNRSPYLRRLVASHAVRI